MKKRHFVSFREPLAAWELISLDKKQIAGEPKTRLHRTNKMAKETNTNITTRFLWQARQRSGLTQKTIAHLLGRKFTDEISRYENGQRIPTLQTALKLEIIYRVPIRLLFYEKYRN